MYFNFGLCFFAWYSYSNSIPFAISARTKKYEAIIKKKKRENYKTILFAKSKLNSIKFLASMALIDSNISHNEFVLMKNVLKDMKEEIKNWEYKSVYQRF